ncbi:hypothetical protein J5N97_024703 [Dioscorea zingiberensis]|uniref:SURP motif domain-containing protein n=1 Tax=Dioscorea zingiberensis TaxID=325984 RepID=A0A9D5H8W2_9LILI|nr:hypothetical protein J5N97_024703 [Dioscorea zingiberensis]
MYGQGNFTFRPGPSTPLPPYQQASPAPMVPSHQAPPGPPPPPMVHQGLPCPPPHQALTGPLPMAYQHSPLAPPQPVRFPTSSPVNMGQHHLNSPQIIHGRASFAPSFPPVGSSYPSPMPDQNVQYSMQPMPSPRVLPLPPLASSQGQVLCRPQLPPPGIPHLSTTPPPPPPNFVPINPSNLISFSQNPVGDAHASSRFLPPPPPPPSSPPPLPTSPPPPSSPKANALTIVSEGLPKASPEKPVECDDGDGLLESASLTDDMLAQRRSPHAGLGDYRKNIYLVERESLSNNEMKLSLQEGEASRSFPSTPPKPTDTETVKIIEVLCQFIAKVGPSFEIEAREKEVNNPRFSFLFGGVPGSAAAIGHEYFQWMKRKYCTKASDEQVSALHSDNSLNEEAILPADSDMDMEDDVSQPDRDLTIDQLNGASARESASVCSVVPILDESTHAPECTSEQLKQDIAMPNNLSCSGSSMLLQVDRDEDNSLVIEDLSPDRRVASHYWVQFRRGFASIC